MTPHGRSHHRPLDLWLRLRLRTPPEHTALPPSRQQPRRRPRLRLALRPPLRLPRLTPVRRAPTSRPPSPGLRPHKEAGIYSTDLSLKLRTNFGKEDNLLPSAVLDRKQGYCVGIAGVYFSLAEDLGLPVRAVATPSHVFLRYGGEPRVNIETFDRGAPVPDERYIDEHKIAPESIRKGIFLRDLTSSEFLALLHNNLGVIHSGRGDYAAAAREYDAALALLPRFPAALYNRGNDLLHLGEYAGAVGAFSRSLSLHPNDAWALNNRGVAHRLLDRHEKARRDFEAALRLDPGFAAARANLDALTSEAPPVPPVSRRPH